MVNHTKDDEQPGEAPLRIREEACAARPTAADDKKSRRSENSNGIIEQEPLRFHNASITSTANGSAVSSTNEILSATAETKLAGKIIDKGANPTTKNEQPHAQPVTVSALPGKGAEEEGRVLASQQKQVHQSGTSSAGPNVPAESPDLQSPSESTTIAPISSFFIQELAPQIQPLPVTRNNTAQVETEERRPGAYINFPGRSCQRLQPSAASALLSSSRRASVSSRANLMTRNPVTIANNDNPGTAISTINNAHQGLVEARAVPDEEDPHLMVAQEESSLRNRQKSRNDTSCFRRYPCVTCLLIGVGAIGFLALIVWLVVALRDNATNASGSGAYTTPSNYNRSDPTDAPSSTFIKQFLPKGTLDALTDPGSSQSKAFQWLQNDPQLRNFSKERLSQRFALATFYFATNGKSWVSSKSWLSYELHECFWSAQPGHIDVFSQQQVDWPPCEEQYYIENENKDSLENTTERTHSTTASDNVTAGIYKRLWMRNNSLDGTIPEEIFWLSHLESFDVMLNRNISGTMSTAFGTLTKLGELDIAPHWFEGTLPSELGLLTKLSVLTLRGQKRSHQGPRLVGTLPTELSQLTNMQLLGIGMNNITGTIPVGIFRNTKLMSFDAVDTFISGALPSEVGMATALLYFWIFGTRLSGPIPSEIGNLKHLVWLDLSSNSLSGSVPSELGCMEGLQELALTDNALSSSLPTELGQLPRIYNLDLSRNNLTGSLLAFNLSSIKTLRLSQNHFSGPIHSELGHLVTLEELDLSHNSLTSRIPREMGNLSALREAYLQDNLLSGELPSDLANLQLLEVWNSANNDLTGEIALKFSLWPSITTFNISGNHLIFGSIPAGLCNINESISFDCSDDLCGCSSCPCPESP